MLREALHKINQELPASVYIPFVSNSIRNYAVLHIPLSECRVFQTKERAPFMIAVELYRPDELNLYSANTYPLQSQDGGFAHMSSSPFGKTSIEEYKSKPAAHAFMSSDSFKMNDDEDDDDEIFHDALAHVVPSKKDDENPYLKEAVTKSSKKQRKMSKGGGLRKNSTDIHIDENENISKLADMRVSNAVTINNKLSSRKKDQFIKKILKEDGLEDDS